METAVNQHYHYNVYLVTKHDHFDDTGSLRSRLALHPAVDKLGLYKEGDSIQHILTKYPFINTVFIDPYTHGFTAAMDMILYLRNKDNGYRHICIVLICRNKEGESLSAFFEQYPDRSHYIKLDYNYDVPDMVAAQRLEAVLAECRDQFFYRLYKYELAISYCSANQEIVSPIAAQLKEKAGRVFYSAAQQDELTGASLENELPAVYMEQSRYCVLFISKEYSSRVWTGVERDAALLRNEKQPGYLIPVSIDDATLPEHIITGEENNAIVRKNAVVYYSIAEGTDKLVSMILNKIWVMKPKSFHVFNEL